MQTRRLGRPGPGVSTLGLGGMGITKGAVVRPT